MPRTLVIQRTFSDGSAPLKLGNAIEYSRGWKFFPATVAHKPSRKFHPTLEKALPKWVGYPHSTRSFWKGEPIQITALKSDSWNMQAIIYEWPDDGDYEVRIKPIRPSPGFIHRDQPRFTTLLDATAHAKIILGL